MAPNLLDVDAESRRALQFDDVLEQIAGHCGTAMGAAAIRALAPLADAEALAAELETLGEVLRWVEGAGRIVPTGLPDPRGLLAPLGIEGVRLEARALRDLSAVLMACAEARAALAAADPRDFPSLTAFGARLPDLRVESRRILGGVDGEGRIADEASAELQEVRRAQRRVGERLHGMLTRILREPASEPVIRDDFITQRNGRWVVPVRTDAPRPLAGIIHGVSSSGATRFVEPLESVELNNELVALAEAEREEQDRILLRWSEAFRRRLPEVEAAVAAIARLDGLQARADYARDMRGVLARPSPATVIDLRGVRHPLLDRRLRDEGLSAVPLDLRLDPADQVLVLSGPNTGGKTVALKTVGLAVLMAQAGIPVPARGCELPVFRQVRADVGDHQSLDTDLSTFSAHVRAVKGFLDDARSPGLFLFDEIGTGTDPAEGAALAQAILERLQRPGITTVATTHQEALKAWALTTAGALTAAMEFDSGSLRPTYRVVVGAAGESAGLAIAERLGLDPVVIAAARRRMGPESDLTRRYADRLRDLVAEAEREREAVEVQRVELEAERARQAAAAERTERERAAAAARDLEAALDEFRREVKRELAALNDPRERAALARRGERAGQRLRGEQQRHAAVVAPSPQQAEIREWRRPDRLEEGQRVHVVSLGREGRVAQVRGSRVEVQLGRVAFTVDVDDLRVGPGGATAREAPVARAAEPERPESPTELKLIGLTVEEGLEALDRFLDDAVMAGHQEVRIVHGHGTGRLRRAVREHLARHRQVAERRPGEPHEGGDGATIARLKG